MRCELVTTREGATAVLDRDTMEVMHPIVGPRIEAQRIYVEPSRLEARLLRGGAAFVLFDVGLGAGSNAIAAWHLSERLPTSARPLEIVSFDRSRAAIELALTQPAAFDLEGAAGEAARAVLREGEHRTLRTRWRYVEGELPSALLGQGPADMVWWDAFSPRNNPIMWTAAAFAALRPSCGPGCTVLTFSGATAVRSALLLAGFAVGVGVPIGKEKHATFAAVDVEDIAEPLDQRWLDRLTRSSAPMPSDAPADAWERVARAKQFAAR